MSDLKPLWSDDKTERHIDCVGQYDPDYVITNLYEDVKCLNERNESMQAEIDKLKADLASAKINTVQYIIDEICDYHYLEDSCYLAAEKDELEDYASSLRDKGSD